MPANDPQPKETWQGQGCALQLVITGRDGDQVHYRDGTGAYHTEDVGFFVRWWSLVSGPGEGNADGNE